MSEKRKYSFHDGKTGVAVAIRVTTRAAKNELVEIQDDGTIKIRIKAAPVDGKANQMIIEFLSDLLDVPKSNVEIVAGLSSKNKLVSIMSLTSQQIQNRLVLYLQK